MLKLSALNFSSLYDQKDVRCELKDTVELAPHLEEMGYHRYWLGEHHTFNAAYSSPELLLPLIAQATTKLRLGVAGIRIHLHNPFKIAKDFAMLASLFPNRIDLGLAASGVDEPTKMAFGNPVYRPLPKCVKALTDNLDAASLSWKISEVSHPPFIRGSAELDYWMLSNGGRSTTKAAAEQGLALGLAFFIKPKDPCPSIVYNYREAFIPVGTRTEPKVNIVVSGVCAETTEEAHNLANHWLNHGLRRNVVGNQDECRKAILDLKATYNVDEVVFLDLSPTYKAKMQSYRLLSEALLT